MIPDTGTCRDIFDPWYLTPVLAMLYLTLIYDTGTCHAILDTWYLTPILAMLYLTLIYDTGTCHAILDTWYLTPIHACYTWPWYMTPVLAMLYLTHDIYNTGIWHVILDTWHLYYLAYSWLLYCYQIFSTPELLYSWTRERGWLLILYSWYYISVNSCSWIIMVMLYTLVDIIFGQYI